MGPVCTLSPGPDRTLIDTVPHLPHAKLRSYQGLVPKTEDWRTLGASDEERAALDGLASFV